MLKEIGRNTFKEILIYSGGKKLSKTGKGSFCSVKVIGIDGSRQLDDLAWQCEEAFLRKMKKKTNLKRSVRLS